MSSTKKALKARRVFDMADLGGEDFGPKIAFIVVMGQGIQTYTCYV